MIELAISRGPVSRLSAVYEFFRQEQNCLSPAETNFIIEKFKDKVK